MSVCKGVTLFGNCIGNEEEVKSNFSSNSKTVMETLNKLSQELEVRNEAVTTLSNNATTAGNTVDLVGNFTETEMQIGHKIKQDSEVNLAFQVTSLMEIMSQIDANADVKLDALATMTSSITDSSVLKASPSDYATDTNITAENQVKMNNITDISYMLAQSAKTFADNKLEAGANKVRAIGNFTKSKFQVGDNVEQNLKTTQDFIMSLANESVAISSAGLSAEVKAEIERQFTAVQKGAIESAGDAISNIASSFSGPIVIGVIIFLAICALFLIIKFGGTKKIKQQLQFGYQPLPQNIPPPLTAYAPAKPMVAVPQNIPPPLPPKQATVTYAQPAQQATVTYAQPAQTIAQQGGYYSYCYNDYYDF
jgi:hypothetical protein